MITSSRLATGLVLITGIATAHAATIIVPDHNPSLREAVENAAPGDVVQVRPGTYNDRVKVEDGQTGLVIEGLGGTPTINPGPGDDGFRIRGVDGVTIRGFTVTGGMRGVRVEDAANTVIESVTILVPRQDGVWLKGTTGATLTLVHVPGPGGRGIRIDQTTGTTVINPTVSGAKKEGLRAVSNTGLTVQTGMFVTGLRDGVRVVKGSSVTLDSNLASDNVRSGIRVQTVTGLAVSNNATHTNGEYGLRVQKSPPITSVTDLVNAGNVAIGNGEDDLRAD